MTHASQITFVPTNKLVAERVLPHLHHAQKLPLRISCLGIASYAGCGEADSFERDVLLGACASPDEAIAFAAMRVSSGDIRAGSNEMLRFRPRLIVVQDSTLSLVLAGEIRAGIILWQHPVANDGEACRIVIEASRLRGMAFAASGRGDHGSARDLRFRASLLEARLVDSVWRETAAELLHLPQALISRPIPSNGPVPRRALSFPEPVMADYLTHFSCRLDVGTPDNAARALDL